MRRIRLYGKYRLDELVIGFIVGVVASLVSIGIVASTLSASTSYFVGVLLFLMPVAGVVRAARMGVTVRGEQLLFRDFWWSGEIDIASIRAIEQRDSDFASQGRLVLEHGTKKFRACVSSQLVLELGWEPEQRLRPLDRIFRKPWSRVGQRPGPRTGIPRQRPGTAPGSPFLVPKLNRDLRWNATHWGSFGPRRQGQRRPSLSHCCAAGSLSAVVLGLVSWLVTGFGSTLVFVACCGLVLWFLGVVWNWVMGLSMGWAIDPVERALVVKRPDRLEYFGLDSIASIETVTEGVRREGWVMLRTGEYAPRGASSRLFSVHRSSVVLGMIPPEALSEIKAAIAAGTGD